MATKQRNLTELYRVRESTEWYWRAIGTTAAGLVLLGFLLFPASFPTTTVDTNVNQNTLSIVSVILLALGYSLSVALWFICRSWLYQFDVLFVPCLFSSLLGAVNIGVTIGVSPSSDTNEWSPSTLSALALSIASSIIYAGLCAFTWMRIRAARARGTSTTTSDRNTLVHGDADLQRKAWERLLSPRPTDMSAAAVSNTYRLDIPDHVRLGEPPAGAGPRSGSISPITRNTSTTHGSGTLSAFPTESPPLASSSFGASTVPIPQLTPAAAALQQARERTIHNERSAARLNGASTARTPSQRGTPQQFGGKDEQFMGAVHRPNSDVEAQTYEYEDDEPRYEVVNVPNFQIPLSQVRRRQDDAPVNSVGELEARMADGGRSRNR